jgi:hypothetical protein
MCSGGKGKRARRLAEELQELQELQNGNNSSGIFAPLEDEFHRRLQKGRRRANRQLIPVRY